MKRWQIALILLANNALWLGFFALTGYLQLGLLPKEDPVLAKLDPQARQYYKSKIVTVTAGNRAGSGCEIEPGYYLTALHVISNALLDNDSVHVNDKVAKLLYKGTTEEDYAVVSTLEKPDPKKAELPFYNFQEGEDFIQTGHPGKHQSRVQTGKVVSMVVMNDEGTAVKPASRAIYTEYVDQGISGGCVYPMGWLKPVGVAIKTGDNDPEKRKGEISLASKRIE